MLIHEDASTFHIRCGVVAEESLGIWSATDGTEHILGGDGLVFVLLLEMNSSEFTVFFQSLHHGVVVDLDAAFFHDHLEILADLAVHIWQDAVHPFDDGDLGAKIGECVGEFNADDAAADDGDGIWTLAQLEELIAGDNAWQLHAWNVQHDWLGASGEDDVVGGVVTVPSAAVTCTVLFAWSTPRPLMRVTPLPLKSCSTPPTSWLMVSCL